MKTWTAKVYASAAVFFMLGAVGIANAGAAPAIAANGITVGTRTASPSVLRVWYYGHRGYGYGYGYGHRHYYRPYYRHYGYRRYYRPYYGGYYNNYYGYGGRSYYGSDCY